MLITYNKIIKKHIQDFILSLSKFKKAYVDDGDFEYNLKMLHMNFEKLRNVKKNLTFVKNKKIEIFENGDLIEYRLENFKLFKHKNFGFISIETGSTELNEFLFSKRNENLINEVSLFSDYDKIVCDYCGNFGFEIPKNKVIDNQRILSFHDLCFKKIEEIFNRS